MISCSKSSKSGVSKNSRSEISRPSQIFFIVETVVLAFRPLIMLFKVDCVTPLIVANRFNVILYSWQRSIILVQMAVFVLIKIHS